MYPFSTPWKHPKTVRFSDIFRGYRKGALGTNGLTSGERGGSLESDPKLARGLKKRRKSKDAWSQILENLIFITILLKYRTSTIDFCPKTCLYNLFQILCWHSKKFGKTSYQSTLPILTRLRMYKTSWKRIYSAFPLNIFLYFQLACDDVSKNVIFGILLIRSNRKGKLAACFNCLKLFQEKYLPRDKSFVWKIMRFWPKQNELDKNKWKMTAVIWDQSSCKKNLIQKVQ